VGYDTVTDNNGLFFIYLAIIGAQICKRSSTFVPIESTDETF